MANEKHKKAVLYSVGALLTGIIGFVGWRLYNQTNSDTLVNEDNVSETKSTAQNSSITKSTYSTSPAVKKTIAPVSEFPIKKGSKGDRVKQLQQALIEKYGKSIFPKSGADGVFGSEMSAALSKLNLPQEINESTFNLLTKGKNISPAQLAETLYYGARAKDFSKVDTALSTMKSVNDYQMVNEIFKSKYVFPTSTFPVRKTLVTGLLDSFIIAAQKEKIGLHFSRMGLKYNGNQWSLSGIIQNPIRIITIENSTVHSKEKGAINIQANTILGDFIAEKHGFILFENQGKRFYVSTSSVKKI